MNESCTGIYTNTSKQYKRIIKPRPESGNRINKENPNWDKILMRNIATQEEMLEASLANS